MAAIMIENVGKLFAQDLNLFFLMGARFKEMATTNSFAEYMCLKHKWTSPEYDEYYMAFLAYLTDE